METFNRRHQVKRRKTLRNSSTESEVILWSCLKKKQRQGRRFRRQYGIGNTIVDFYCPSVRLIVEVDGDVHLLNEVLEHDRMKEDFYKQLKLNILRFTNEEVKTNLTKVLNKIDQTIKNLSSQRSEEVPEGRRGGHSC